MTRIVAVLESPPAMLTACGMFSPTAVCGRLPNRMKRNAAAFCASNPRRAAVKVRASQGSIGRFSNDAVRCVAKPTIAGDKGSNLCRKLRNMKRSRPDAAEHCPKCIFRPQRSKIIRKVSNFDQTTTQNEGTFSPEPMVRHRTLETERDIQVIGSSFACPLQAFGLHMTGRPGRSTAPAGHSDSEYMAPLSFTCPTTRRQSLTRVETDTASLATAWKKTLRVECPHCGEVHRVSVREAYIASVIQDGTDHDRPPAS